MRPNYKRKCILKSRLKIFFIRQNSSKQINLVDGGQET